MKSRDKKILNQFVDDPNVRIRINVGDLKIFIFRTKKGFVVGPREPLNGAKDDHLTVGLKEEDFQQIHRTTDGVKQWWHTEASVEESIAAFMRSNTTVLTTADLVRPGVYIVSWRRTMALLSIFNFVVRIPVFFFGRMILQYNIIEMSEKRIVIRFGIDKRRAAFFVRRIGYPFSRALSLFGKLPAQSFSQGILALGRSLLGNVDKKGRLSTDFGLLLSKDRQGIIWTNKEGKICFVSLGALNEAQQAVQDGMPFGRIEKVMESIGPYGEITLEKN